MEVKNCRGCGRLFNYVGGVTYANLCPKCVEELEAKFQEAKAYIEEHDFVGISEVAEAVGVKPIQIERWVREERLYFSDSSAVGIPCEKCGVTIKSGRYCEQCKDNLSKTLGALYSGGVVQRKRPTDSAARMRFLDNNKPQ